MIGPANPRLKDGGTGGFAQAKRLLLLEQRTRSLCATDSTAIAGTVDPRDNDENQFDPFDPALLAGLRVEP